MEMPSIIAFGKQIQFLAMIAIENKFKIQITSKSLIGKNLTIAVKTF